MEAGCQWGMLKMFLKPNPAVAWMQFSMGTRSIGYTVPYLLHVFVSFPLTHGFKLIWNLDSSVLAIYAPLDFLAEGIHVVWLSSVAFWERFLFQHISFGSVKRENRRVSRCWTGLALPPCVARQSCSGGCQTAMPLLSLQGMNWVSWSSLRCISVCVLVCCCRCCFLCRNPCCRWSLSMVLTRNHLYLLVQRLQMLCCHIQLDGDQSLP